MKIEPLLNSLVRDLWQDLQEPAVGWQLATLAGCLLLAWFLERMVLRRWDAARPGVARRGATAARQALGRALFPLFALGLVLVARPLLAVWHHTNLLRVAIALLVAFALARTVVYAVSQLSRTRGLAAFERLLVALVWVAVALYLTGYWIDVIDFLESIVFPMGRHRVSLWTILSGSFWVLVTLLVAMWLGGVLESRLLAVDSGDPGVRAVLGRIIRALVLLLAVLIGMSIVGLDLTALSVFGGALGVGIGLGLQRIASSYVSGFVVLLERRVRIGDMITVDKYYGQVAEISSRFTIVRSADGWESIVPNELLMTNPVQNHSLRRQVRLKTALTVAYDSEVPRVLAMLVEAATAHPRVLREPAPAAFMTGFGADGFNVEVGYSIADPENGRLAVESEVNQAIWTALRGAGVSLPYPQREIRLLSKPPQGL